MFKIKNAGIYVVESAGVIGQTIGTLSASALFVIGLIISNVLGIILACVITIPLVLVAFMWGKRLPTESEYATYAQHDQSTQPLTYWIPMS